eukprot:1200673-Amphidinium_carterae.1
MDENRSKTRFQKKFQGGNRGFVLMGLALQTCCTTTYTFATSIVLDQSKLAVESHCQGLADKFDIDSCGTGGGNSNWYQPDGWSYHEGDSLCEDLHPFS